VRHLRRAFHRGRARRTILPTTLNNADVIPALNNADVIPALNNADVIPALNM